MENLDGEIGRLLSGIGSETLEDTTVFFVSDGGTPRSATAPPLDPKRGKQTMYEGGTNVPLIVAGPHVAQQGGECAALVHVTDIFATVADIAGVLPERLKNPEDRWLELDGLTLLPHLQNPRRPSQRKYVYTEYFGLNGKPPYQLDERAIRDTKTDTDCDESRKRVNDSS